MRRLGPMLRIKLRNRLHRVWRTAPSANLNEKIDDLAEAQDSIVIHMRPALNISIADIEAARSLRERPTNPSAFNLILRRVPQLYCLRRGTTDPGDVALRTSAAK